MGKALRAELLKALTLPTTWIAALIAIVLPLGLEIYQTRGLVALLEASDAYSLGFVPDAGFISLVFGASAAIMLGTGVMASEYRANAPSVGSSRQASTTLLVMPRRVLGMTARLLVVLGLVAVLAAAASGLTFAWTHHALGSWSQVFPFPWGRWLALLGWWELNAVWAVALAAVSRGSLLPLAWLIPTATLVSPSLLFYRMGSAVVQLLPDYTSLRLIAHSWPPAGGPGTGPAPFISSALAFGVQGVWLVVGALVAYAAWVWRRA
ncbi:ABC-2 family transporter protein [Actinomyces bovis]|uniref:ABC-2 family transporter protein n=1 Tax=Actinomyces bovis TaxID=1658 RepID=A0ABY1VNI7_9ACTO|nr:hypothetical protein [Actinomyces bovis]SPT53674.1 ABC-2 family transporter protein [Actinomyces bovis]VEG55778.1 ABC-2 family transporter protein [Actinomyces israelii]